MARRNATQNDEPTAAPKPTRRQVKQRQLRIFLISIGVLAVLSIAAVVLYQFYVAPFRRPVVVVDGSVIRMAYFLDRARMAGNDPSATIQQLVYEQVVKLAAPGMGASVPESEIDNALQEAALNAASNNETQHDVSTGEGFQSWYKEILKDSGLSDSQYRDIVRVNILAEQIKMAIAQSIPDKGEQVHLHVIVLRSAQDANNVKALLDKGEDFAAVAKQRSLDTATRGSGGDLGWVPKGLLPYDDTVFQLQTGQVSAPVMTNPVDPATSQYLLFKVSEKDPEHTIDAAVKVQLAQTAFYYWINQEIQKHEISYELTESDQAWVNWQLAKVRK